MERIGTLKGSGVSNPDLEDFQKKFQLESMRYLDADEKEYDNMLTTHGIISRLNVIACAFPKHVQNEYNKIPLQFNNKTDFSLCEICGCSTTFKHGHLICEHCGFNKNIGQICYGGAQQKKQYKSRETMDHYCEEWLEHLQGKGVFNLSSEIYNQIFEFARVRCRGDARYANEIKCSDIRRWLTQLKVAKYNKYIPAIHRRITRDLGNEVIPPQFTENEKQVIIADWKFLSATYSAEYKKIKQRGNKKRNNMPYYPVCIYFIIAKRFVGDARVKQFEEYIHKQSVDTYKLRLQCWEETCRILNYTGSGRY